MKTLLIVSLVCIALQGTFAHAMRPKSKNEGRSELTRAQAGTPDSPRRLSVSAQSLGDKLRMVLKKSMSNPSLDASVDDSSDNDNVSLCSSEPTDAPSNNLQPGKVSSTSSSQDEDDRLRPNDLPLVFNSTPYPAERLLLGLQVQWLQTESLEKMHLVGIDSTLVSLERKQLLIEHMRAVHASVKHEVLSQPGDLNIDVTKLPKELRRMLLSESAQTVNVSTQLDLDSLADNLKINEAQLPKELVEHAATRHTSSSLFKSLQAPVASGIICFTLGLILAKKIHTSGL